MHQWQVQEAKAKLSEVVKLANSEGPQAITLRGESAAVVLSYEDYQQLVEPKSSFVNLIRKSPLLGAKLDLTRNKSKTRDIDL